MPLYEYSCRACGKDFTLLQKIGVNKEETVCAECGSREVEPKPSSFASKVQGEGSLAKARPATANDYPNKNVFKLPIPKLRSEL